MTPVAVCVCTCRRPLGLRAVLAALALQRLQGSGLDVTVVVVDNDPNGGTRGLLAEAGQQLALRIHYVHERRQGLAFARNAALQAAREMGARYLAFIDDDELPHPGWLPELASAIVNTGAAAAIGPVKPVFEEHPSRWLPVEAYTTRAKHRDGLAASGYSGNCMLDLTVISAARGCFDERFNATGGEDTVFFARLMCDGHRLAWAERALVLETVAPNRMSRLWLWRRWYRTGAIEARIMMIEGHSPAPTLKALAKGAIRIAGGIARIGAALMTQAWRRPDRVTGSFYTLCRGAGYIGGALGRVPAGYADPTRS